MSADLGWGREVFAFALALQNLMWGVFQPFAGAIADKWGAGRVVMVGGLLYALGLHGMATAADPTALQLNAGVLIGLAQSGAGLSVALGAVARTVPAERRSWALGVVTAAGSLGQVVVAPLGQAFLEAYGWSAALMLLGLSALLIAPLGAVLRGRAETPAAADSQSLVAALAEARRHRGFLLLTSGFFVCGFHVAFIAVHLPAFLVDGGLPAEVGAWALALIGLANVAGSYASGVLGGRFSKKYLLSGLYLARAALFLLFIALPLSTASALGFAAVLGLLWLSTVPLTSGLVAQIFGPRYLATLFGIVFFSHQLGSFIGVWLGGYLYDVTGSYLGVWWTGVALGVAAAVIHWPIDDRPVARLAEARQVSG